MRIKHVNGNVLRIDIPLTVKIITSEQGQTHVTEEPFYPDISRPVLVELANKYNTRYTYEATMTENVAHIEDDGLARVGVYKVTVKCFDEQGQPYRYMARDIIDIVDATADAGIEAGIEFDSETYTLEGAYFIKGEKGDKGDDGITPHIDDTTGNWFVGDEDTGVHAQGEQGEPGTTDYNELENKPTFKTVNGESIIGEGDIEITTTQQQSDWNETNNTKPTFIKNKPNIPSQLSQLSEDTTHRTVTDSEKSTWNGKQDTINDLSEIRSGAAAGATAVQTETDPTVPSWAKQSNKPSYNANEVGALPSSTKYGATLDMSLNTTDYKLTVSLKDQDGTVLNYRTVDFPIESVVVSGSYDSTNKKIVLTLQSGSTIDVPVGDLVAGLQSEITALNMLDADLVDDTNSTHKLVTTSEKSTWNAKYSKPSSGIPASDIASGVIPTVPTISTNIESDGSSDEKTASPKAVKSFVEGKGYTTNTGTITGINMNGSSKGTSGVVDLGTVLTQHQDISGKADKNEMSVVDGTGTDADKTTITLKSGTSATVLKSHQDISGKQDTLVSGTNIKTINNESVLGSGNINIVTELPSNLAYTSNDNGEGIIPSDGIRAESVTSAATMSINPDVVTIIGGVVGTAAITLQVPQDNLAHVWDILMTTDSSVAITFAMSNSATILYPSGFSVGASKAVEISVIGVGTKYYLRYGEFA